MSDAAPAKGDGAADAGAGPGPRRWLHSLLLVPTPVIFVSAALLAVLFLWRQGGLAELGDPARSVSPWQALAVLFAYGTSILALGFRWHVLVRMAGAAASWTASVEVFLTSVIVNYAAPIGLAVPTRAALTVRDLGLRPVQGAAVVAWEAGLDVAALSTIVAVWLLVGGLALVQTMAIDPRLVAGAVAALVVILVVALWIGRTVAPARRLAQAMRHLISLPVRSPGLAVLAVTLTAGYWLLQCGVMAALLSAFGTTPSVALLTGVMGLPILIGMLSPLPGGAGVREALMAGAAELDGVAAGPVLLAAIAYRLALFMITPVVWALVRVARHLTQGRS